MGRRYRRNARVDWRDSHGAFATSDDIPGLVAQGRTVTETIEIARDVARKLIEAQTERAGDVRLADLEDAFDYPLVLG